MACNAIIKRAVIFNDIIRFEFPYTTQGCQGAETLLQLLTEHGNRVQFMPGRITEHMQGLAFEPGGGVYEHEQQTMLLQPFVDSSLPLIESNHVVELDDPALSKSTIIIVLDELDGLLSEMLIMGFDFCTLETHSRWLTLLRQTTQFGMHHLRQLLSETVD